MSDADDLIRRDTAERAIRARQRDTEDSGIYAGLSVALQELAALPADPVAEAITTLRALSEKYRAELGPHTSRRLACGFASCVCHSSGHTHTDNCYEDEQTFSLAGPKAMLSLLDACDAVRAAVAARAAGTVPPAPKPAPACARCGGRGCVPRVYLGTGTVGEDDCPECRGKP